MEAYENHLKVCENTVIRAHQFLFRNFQHQLAKKGFNKSDYFSPEGVLVHADQPAPPDLQRLEVEQPGGLELVLAQVAQGVVVQHQGLDLGAEVARDELEGNMWGISVRWGKIHHNTVQCGKRCIN